MEVSDYESHASFGLIWKVQDGVLWVLAVNVINREGEMIRPLKLIGGKADPQGPGRVETPFFAFNREVREESGIEVSSAEEVYRVEKKDYESSYFTARHTMHFFLSGPDDFLGEVAETKDITQGVWVSISEFAKNHIGTHHEGFFACLDRACQKYPGFYNILRAQRYFENFEPKEESE